MWVFAITLGLLSVVLAVPNAKLEGMHPYFVPSGKASSAKEGDTSYWEQAAQQAVTTKVSQKLNTNTAKNVILFLGDGMSVPTVSSARVYKSGEAASLAFDDFPWTGLSKTYAVDRQVPDSANTATAYLCGVKANYGTIGVGPEILYGDCSGQSDATHHVLSIAYHSQNVNKSTGLVTTARVTHASPGGVYAHTADRDWECDSDIIWSKADPKQCDDIASQLVYGETGQRLDVILGGGRAKFLPSDTTDEEGKQGGRSDGVNLIEEWLKNQPNGQYVWNKTALLELDDTTEKVLGLFNDDHLDYNLERDTNMDPSLAEMTEAAINILSKNNNGFFLFVEGARIDMAHHAARAQLALDETTEFSKAVQRAVDLTDEADTLIVVTADHAHTLSYGGYAERGNDIFGFAGTGADDLPYFTLSYGNGPGYSLAQSGASRHDASKDDHDGKDYLFPGAAPLDAETHGGDDVAIYARGPQSHLFSGVNEQNVIPHLMSYASCVGTGVTVCDSDTGGAASLFASAVLVMILSSYLLFLA